MTIKTLILRDLRKKGEIRTKDVVKKTGLSRAYVQRVLGEMVKEGILALVGRANQARYVPASLKKAERARAAILSTRRILKNQNLSEDRVLDDLKQSTGIFLNTPQNVSEILDYAFTEMLNNAIEHSGSEKIEIRVKRTKEDIRFEIIDRGVGIYKHIMAKRGLSSELEAIQDLLKGKQTTAPNKHTGEGIFFTSRVVSILTIHSSGKRLVFDNKIGDIFIRKAASRKGTKVTCEVMLSSGERLSHVFRKYAGRAFAFDATEINVKLYQIDTAFISRSQARRVLAGLEKFKIITLDFSGVETAGQGFADEIFRVWKKKHPDIDVRYKNANENIEFMIKRAVA